jgi:hypothetical protein
VWVADLPDATGNDAYVAVKFEGGRLVAHSWSCYRVEIDIETGKILSKIFTK